MLWLCGVTEVDFEDEEVDVGLCVLVRIRCGFGV